VQTQFEVAQPIIAGLNANRSLRVLTLACEEFNGQCATQLGEAIGGHPRMVEMNGEFPGSGTLKLVESALARKTLLDLDLHASNWGFQAGEELSSSLKTNTTLLNLGFPMNFDKETSSAILRILHRNRRGNPVPSAFPASV
jgi:hypothetical protein